MCFSLLLFEKSVPELLVCGVFNERGQKGSVTRWSCPSCCGYKHGPEGSYRMEVSPVCEILAMYYASREAQEKDRVRGHAYRQTLQISRTRWINQNFSCGRPNPPNYKNPRATGCCITSWRGRWLGVVEVRTIVQEKFHHCPMTSMKTTLEFKCTLKRKYLRTNLT